MCIICNMADKHELASEFLRRFEVAQQGMKAAADAMLEVSKAAGPEHRQRYDAIHKEMVRQCREWNKLEEKREHQ